MAAYKKSTHSFGAGAIINYEFNEFVREQCEKRPFRRALALTMVSLPAIILFAWAVQHVSVQLTALAPSRLLVDIVARISKLAIAALAMDKEWFYVVEYLYKKQRSNWEI